MALTLRQRFDLKRKIVEALNAPEWSLDQINLLLAEFGLPRYTADLNDPPLSESIAAIDNDDDLNEIAVTVLGEDGPENAVVTRVGGGASQNWKPGHLRLFVSHAAERKAEVAEVAAALRDFGVHGFVAHDDMKVSLSWQLQIEEALASMDAFVALVHPELNDSAWCHQEIGWAKGRRTPCFAIRLGADPRGFLQSDQWPSVRPDDPHAIAIEIFDLLADEPDLNVRVVGGLITALERANTYRSAEGIVARLWGRDIGDDQFVRLGEIWHNNSQVNGAWGVRRDLPLIYKRHGKAWPPATDGQRSR